MIEVIVVNMIIHLFYLSLFLKVNMFVTWKIQKFNKIKRRTSKKANIITFVILATIKHINKTYIIDRIKVLKLECRLGPRLR